YEQNTPVAGQSPDAVVGQCTPLAARTTCLIVTLANTIHGLRPDASALHPAPLHSARNAIIGSTRTARHAGITAALTAMAISSVAEAISVAISLGATPNMSDSNTRADIRAAGIPRPTPAPARITASRTTKEDTSR